MHSVIVEINAYTFTNRGHYKHGIRSLESPWILTQKIGICDHEVRERDQSRLLPPNSQLHIQILLDVVIDFTFSDTTINSISHQHTIIIIIIIIIIFS
jgi:hypothetical protein